MKKLTSYILFFNFILFYSSVGMEEKQGSFLTIKKEVAQMGAIMPFLKEMNIDLSKTAIHIDYDETLVRTEVVYKGCVFKYLPCPDRERTYKGKYIPAFKSSGIELKNFDIAYYLGEMTVEESYKILDDDTTGFVCDISDACFLGVCSALEADRSKKQIMKHIGIPKENYVFAPKGKPYAICGQLIKLKQDGKNITTVVLIDNSEEYSIDPFIRDLPAFAKDIGFTQLTIIGIVFTKFTDMVTQDVINEELNLLKTLRCNIKVRVSEHTESSSEAEESSLTYGGSDYDGL